MPPQNENFNENCNWRGLNMVLGLPKFAFGEPGIATGKSPSPSQTNGFPAACCVAQDTDASLRWMASVVASL